MFEVSQLGVSSFSSVCDQRYVVSDLVGRVSMLECFTVVCSGMLCVDKVLHQDQNFLILSED